MIPNSGTVGDVVHADTWVFYNDNENNVSSRELQFNNNECESSDNQFIKSKNKCNCLRAIVNSSISVANKKSIKMDIKKYLFLCSFCI